MRNLLTAATLSAAMLACAPAEAQVYPGHAPIPAPGQVRMQGPGVPTAGPRVWQNGRWNALPPSQNVARTNNPNRWGYHRDGRWDAGHRAPGGWNAYRRLGRGHRLPQYWLNDSFGLSDYLSWGLSAPPRGYHWSRYYDDAVLVDYQGNIWDSVDGIGWGGAGAGAWSDDGYASSNSESYSYSSAGAGYGQPIQPVDPDSYYDQQQYPGGYAPPVAYAPPAAHVQPYGQGYGQGYESGYRSSSSYQGGYYGAGSSSVTIIQLPPTVTTTVVEEIVEETVTTSYVRATPRRVIRRAPVKRYKAKAKVVCCKCVCR